MISLEMESEHAKYVQDTISRHSEAFWQKFTEIWDLTRLWGEVKENSCAGTTKISSNPINFDAPQLLARWSTHPILLKNTLKRVCIVYPESILACVFHFMPGIAHLFCDNQRFFGFLDCSSEIEFLRPQVTCKKS